MAKYDFLLLDADETLFDFVRCEHDALCDALRIAGIEPNEEMIAVYSEINDRFWKMLERGEIEKNELRVARFAEFCRHYGFEVDVPRLATGYTDALSTKGHLIKGATEVCRELAGHCKLYIITNGIVMTGGGSLLYGFDQLVEQVTGIKTRVAKDAVSCVAIGTGKSLDNLDLLQEGAINISRDKRSRI